MTLRRNAFLKTAAAAVLAVALAFGQAAPKTAKPPSQVDTVIQLVKAGMSEALIIKTLQKQNKPADLSPADLLKLKNAGVSENIIGVMMDPSSAPAPAQPAPAPAPAPEPPPQPAPAAQPAPAPMAAPMPQSGPMSQGQKLRVSVDEFDYSAVMTSVQAVFGTQQNIGKGIRAMLVKRVAEQGKLVVVERAKVDKLMKEQDFDQSNRVKKGSGARVGQISGADLLLAGDIIIFGRDDKHTKVKGGGLIGRGIGAVGSMNDEDKAVVSINYRLINQETSEIVATGEAKGESVRKSRGFGAMGGALGKGGAGMEVDMTSSNFGQTIIGEATQDCVNKLADILMTQTADMKRESRPVEALVADVSGNVLVITAGSNDGVAVGDIFEIHRVVKDVKDPVTHEVLDRITEKVGEMTVTSVRDKIATGSYAGSQPAAGFLARKRI